MADDAVWINEAEYLNYLDFERQLYAFALISYGGFAPELARQESLKRYPYEHIDTPYRGLIFHKESWHWAMMRLHGDRYWISFPELQDQPEAFLLESERLRPQLL